MVVTIPHTQAIASFHWPIEIVASVPVHPSIAALSVIICIIYRKSARVFSLDFALFSARAKD